MALKNLVSIMIEEGKKIKIPRNANCYKHEGKRRGRCILSHFNPTLSKNYKKLPKKAKFICYIDYREHGDRHIVYGKIIFYDKEGNILKQ